MGRYEQEHIIQLDENYILKTRTLGHKSSLFFIKNVKNKFLKSTGDVTGRTPFIFEAKFTTFWKPRPAIGAIKTQNQPLDKKSGHRESPRFIWD